MTGPEIVYRASADEVARGRLAEMEERVLVERALQGEDLAFEALMNRYAPLVVGVLFRKVSCENDVEDLTQEVFLKAYRNMAALRNRNRFGSLVMRIARTRLIDYYRKRSREPRIVRVDADRDHETAGALDNVPEPSPDPAQRASQAQAKSLVLREIERMSARYRSILYWRLLGEASTVEIAAWLGVNESTVRGRLSRGLKMLRKALTRQGI